MVSKKSSRWLAGKVGRKAKFTDSDLFPNLLTQSQFNRRARGLRYLLELMRRDWLLDTGLGQANIYLLDSKPLPVVGYKLVLISTVDGIPVCYELAAANTEERQAAETVLDYINNALVIADKGFIGTEWQAQMLEQTGNRMQTPKRKNQKIQHRPGYQSLLNGLRERIEGVFHELQNTGRSMEHRRAAVNGLGALVLYDAPLR